MQKFPKTLVRVEIRTSGVFLVYVRGLCSDPLQLGVVSSCLSSSSGLQTTTRALPRGPWSGCKPLHLKENMSMHDVRPHYHALRRQTSVGGLVIELEPAD